ncbi:MMPL family transporter [Limibaculum sp. FT325]|uniref:MMPL family transporter n=1 Tax=Thermohalobaculum sediminis TaxID=2939436 RepID=UPI0020C052BE|nr:MMPL family transporter [Limibaculum sediminis]MCL5778335.1 MMPL family transporter [Limibaculum sediminis]
MTVSEARDRIGDAVSGWVRAVTVRPSLTLALVGLLMLVAAAAASQLGINTDTSRMLSKRLAFQQRVDMLDAAFPAEENAIVIVVRADSVDAADAVVATLESRLSAETEVFDRIFAPSVDPILVAHGLLYLDRDALDERLSRLVKASNLIAELRSDQSVDGFLHALDTATALAAQAGEGDQNLDPLHAETAAVLAAAREGRDRPFRWSSVLSSEGAAWVLRVITLEPKLDFTALEPAGTALAAIRATIAALDPALAEKVQIGVTGNPALRADELQSTTSTLGLSMALSVLLVGLLLRIALGSMARALLALAALGVTVLLTAGFAGIAIGELNLISIAFVVLMVGLGIDYSIHFLSYFDEHSAESHDTRTALGAAGRAIGDALVLSALTTAIAFFAFATTDFVGMAQLGLIGGTGVLIALAVALTVLPAAVALWPGLASGPPPRRLRQPQARIGRILFWLTLVIGLGGLALSPFARFDADPMNLRDPSAPSVEAYRWLVEDANFAPMKLSLLVADPVEAEKAIAALTALPEVSRATWLGDLVPADQAAKLELIDLAYPSIQHAVSGTPIDLAGDAADVTPESLAARLSDRPGGAATALAMQLRAYAVRRTQESDAVLGEQLFHYFPMLLDRMTRQLFAGEITAGTLPDDVRDRFVATDGRLRVEIAPVDDISDPATMATFVRAVSAVAPGVAGPPDQIVGASRAVAIAILQATSLALAGCLLLASIVLRDPVRITAITVPLLLAAAVTTGAGILLDMPFNYANVLVLPLLIGVGIDSGVHFALRASSKPSEVFDTSTPIAILFSALTTIAAFGTLALSHHRGTASMGVLLAISLCAAVWMTFMLTPSLIAWTRRTKS